MKANQLVSRYAEEVTEMSRFAAVADSVVVEEMSTDEGRKMFDAQVRDRLGISAATFLRRLDAGEFADNDDDQVVRLVMLAPFGR